MTAVEERWLDERQMQAWLRLVAVTEILPATLDARLRRVSGLTHFEYQVLAMLSESPDRTLQMSWLARRTNASLPRLSHVVRRLDERGLVQRRPSEADRRATDAVLTEAGWQTVVAAAPDHVATVREHVVDVLTDEQLQQVSTAMAAILASLDPEGHLTQAPAEAAEEPG